MLKKTAEQKKIIAAFLVAILAGMLSTIFPIARYFGFGIRSLSSLIYAGTVLGWVFLIRKRIVEVRVRRYLLLAAVFMIAIFVLRECRWYFFEGLEMLDEFARYGYHFCFIMVPFCALLAALCVGKESVRAMPVILLWLAEATLAALIFTNPVHGLLFRNLDIQTGTYEYGPVYYLCVAWEFLLGLTAFGVILNRCRVSASRRKWYVPFFGMVFGTVLLAVYFIEGGAPSIGGMKIYNLQEVFCLTFILPFEMQIQTGILPSNSRYELFFREGSIAATIKDQEGRTVYASRDKFPKPLPSNENTRMREHEIRGGRITWMEDLTAIRRAEEELRKVTELLEDENGLIAQENEIRAERMGYETQNRFYDKIAGMVRKQTTAIQNSLKDKPQEPLFSERLPYVAVLGAYVKRMGNLMLLSDQRGTISSEELAAAIRETLDSMKLMDKIGSLRVTGEEELPAQLAILAYEMLETVLEQALPDTVGVAVRLLAERASGFLLELRTDETSGSLTEQWKAKERSEIGAFLKVSYEEDEGWCYTLTCPLDRRDGEGAVS